MAIIKKINKNIEYLSEEGLSLKAAGLLNFFLNLNEGTIFTLDDLAVHFSDGITSIRTTIKELERREFLVKEIVRESGKINYLYLVSGSKIIPNDKTDNKEIISDSIIEESPEPKIKDIDSRMSGIDEESIDTSNYSTILDNDDFLEVLDNIEKEDVAFDDFQENNYNEISIDIFNYYRERIKDGSPTISIKYIELFLKEGYSKSEIIEAIDDYKNNVSYLLYKDAGLFFQEILKGYLSGKISNKKEKSTKRNLLDMIKFGGK